MSTAKNTIVAKFAVAFVAVAMVLFLVAPAAKAQTTEELQQMINDLLAQVAALKGEVTTTSTSSVCPYTWTRSLTIGASGADVMKLQQFLNSDPETRVSASGVGSVGMETEYYGALTGAAVAKFQTKYRADILTPLGLVNATTYFGPSTMAKANALCISAPVVEDEDTDEDEDTTDEDSDYEMKGEADLGDTDLKDGDDTDIEEGQEDAPVAEFEVEFNDGDAMIDRIDVAFSATGEEDPWDTFETVSLWVDGDMIAEKNADDEDDYLDEDDGSLRFSGLDLLSKEDDTTVIVIAVTAQRGVDNLPATWNVDVTSIRYTDADDVTSTEDPGVATTDFTLDEEGSDDELKIKTSSNDPDATTFAVETDGNSDWYTVFVFNLDSDDSTNDIELNEIPVTIVTAGQSTLGVNDVVNDAKLVIDGEEFDSFVSGKALSDATSATSTLVFDIDGDYVIDAGDEVEVELMLEFKKTTGNYSNGQTVYASTTEGSLYDVEGADDVAAEGAATGDTHTLRSEGVMLEMTDEDFTLKTNSDSTSEDDQGVFTFKFEVTAFEEDFYFNKTAASGTVSTIAGAEFTIENGGSTVTTGGGVGTTTASLTSTADTVGSRFVVREGETETFTLKVTFDPSTSDFYALQLGGVNYFPSSTSNSPVAQEAIPASDFETDEYSIQSQLRLTLEDSLETRIYSKNPASAGFLCMWYSMFFHSLHVYANCYDRRFGSWCANVLQSS